MIDDPQLTARLWEGRNPVRLLIDIDLRVPVENRIFDDQAMTLVYNGIKEGLESGTVYIRIDRSKDITRQIASDLYHRKIQSVIIEGGAYTLNQFIAAGLWDEARVFTSPDTISAGIPAPRIDGVISGEQRLADDTLIIKLNSSL
jgi:diaminohydroxyphosphoribosylaminopyrimidine deaminase/5-amino-6-(5-phosphoribosylamino)uracil reductase